MAKTIHDHCSAALKAYASQSDAKYFLSSQVRLLLVRVWETSSSWAEYQSH